MVLLRLLRAIEEIRAGTSHPVRLRLLDAKRDGIAEVARRTASSSEARKQSKRSWPAIRWLPIWRGLEGTGGRNAFRSIWTPPAEDGL